MPFHRKELRLVNSNTAMKQEEAAKEEKEALEKIAVILANLTSKKSAMVSQVNLSQVCFKSNLKSLEVNCSQHLNLIHYRSQRHQRTFRTQVHNRIRDCI